MSDPFIVKDYVGDDGPSIKGNGFDGLRVGDSRDEAEEFIAWINAALAARDKQADPVAWEVWTTLGGGNWALQYQEPREDQKSRPLYAAPSGSIPCEPVAWMADNGCSLFTNEQTARAFGKKPTPLYAAPVLYVDDYIPRDLHDRLIRDAKQEALRDMAPIAYVNSAALAALKDKSILGPIPVFTKPFGENTIPLCSHDAPRDMIPREMRDILIRHARREALRQAAESAEHDYALYTAVDFATELRRMADEVS